MQGRQVPRFIQQHNAAMLWDGACCRSISFPVATLCCRQRRDMPGSTHLLYLALAVHAAACVIHVVLVRLHAAPDLQHKQHAGHVWAEEAKSRVNHNTLIAGQTHHQSHLKATRVALWFAISMQNKTAGRQASSCA